MTVQIVIDSGIANATWEDETGAEHETFLGEVSSRWLNDEAESYFGKLLGEDIKLDIYYEGKTMKNKVVYNGCYGGFGISDKAVERYLLLSEIPFVKIDVKSMFGSSVSFFKTEPSEELKALLKEDQYARDTTPEQRIWINENTISIERDLSRHDPILIRIVEKLGEEANGMSADLQIEEIDGNKYRVNEYDGIESIETPEEAEDEWTVI